MIIRECVASDIESVCKLQQRWFDEGIVHGWVPSPPDKLLAALGSHFLVAEQGENLIGFIVGTVKTSAGLAVIPHGESYIEIDDIYVEPESRSENVGSALVERLLLHAKEAGARHALVYSATKDIRRILAFYEKHGFKSWNIQMFMQL